MRHYCTIFDKNYLYQGVALYNSLCQFEDFKLYTLCMDPISYEVMNGLNLSNCIVINVDELLNNEVENVRKNTTFGQFCWICQPLLCSYILDFYNLDMITYLESDSLFFNSPEVLFNEFGNSSVSLVPHNYIPKYDQSRISGKYCVQFNIFRNDENARKVLNYWKDNCFKYNKENVNYLPGQLCLDNWEVMFDGVKILENIGAGVAPWNSIKYKFIIRNNIAYVDNVPVIFFHFHHFGVYQNGNYELGHYPMSKNLILFIYGNYIQQLEISEKIVREKYNDFNYKKIFSLKKCNNYFTIKCIEYFVKNFLTNFKRKLKNSYHIYPKSFFKTK